MPRTVRSRIVKERGTPTADEVPGEPNSTTRIELLDVRGADGLYGLHPATGKVHQLRLHMCSIGLPIRNDNFYPRLLDITAVRLLRHRLQLLAKSVAFDDPYTGERRPFEAAAPWQPGRAEPERSQKLSAGNRAPWPAPRRRPDG